MIEGKGYIYLRDNEWYRIKGVIIMGTTKDLKKTSKIYIADEIKKGKYISIIEIPINKVEIIDKYLKNYFNEYSIYVYEETDTYNRCIYALLEDYLKMMNIEYKVLTKEEINTINRSEKLDNLPDIINNFFIKCKEKIINKRKQCY